jgi:class 3 adenylate cyclase
MAVGGLPLKNQYNAIDTVCAALQMQKFIQDKVKENIEKGQKPWNVRIGIHTGELVAGVIGKTKFAYDVWGNTVNLAARMESTSENGKIQITQFTYDLVKDYFDCTLRGEVEAKNIGKIQTYFVNGLKSEYSIDGFEPNEKYWGRRNA